MSLALPLILPLKLILSANTKLLVPVLLSFNVFIPVKLVIFFFNDPAILEIFSHSLHFAHPILLVPALPTNVPIEPAAPILKVSLPAPPLIVLIPVKLFVMLFATTLPLLAPVILAAIGCVLV